MYDDMVPLIILEPFVCLFPDRINSILEIYGLMLLAPSFPYFGFFGNISKG